MNVADVLSQLDPRRAWRDLQTPLPTDEPLARRAKALRGIARVAFVLGMGALAIFTTFLVLLATAFLDLGAVLDLDTYLVMGLLVCGGLLCVALIVRPFAAAYAREARGRPLPRAALLLAGVTCILVACAAPVLLFVAVFVVHFGGAYPILGGFLGTLTAPWLARSGWRLLKP